MGLVQTALALTLLSCVLILALAPRRRNPQPYHIIFYIFTFFVGVWVSCNLAISLSTSQKTIEVLGKSAYASSAAVIYLYWLFTLYFPESPKPQRRIYFVSATVAAVCMVLASFTHLVQADVVVSPSSKRPVPGPLFHVFALYMHILLFLGTLDLLRKRRKYRTPRIREQLNCILAGFLGSFIPAFIVMFFLLFYTPQSDYLLLGAATPLIWVIATAYGISKYRMFNFSLTLRHIILYATDIIIGLITITMLHILFVKYVSQHSLIPPGVIYLAAGTIVGLGLPALDKALRCSFDRILFKGRFNVEEVLRTITDKVSAQNDPKAMCQTAAAILEEMLQCDFAAIFLFDTSTGHKGSENQRWIRVAYREATNYNVDSVLTAGHPTVRIFRQIDETISTISLSSILEHPADVSLEAMETVRCLHQKGVDLIHAIKLHGKIYGLCVVGCKRDFGFYSAGDIQLFAATMKQFDLMIDRVRMYYEVLISERRMKAILEHMPRGILIIDKSFDITDFNFLAKKLFEKKLELGSNLREVIPEFVAVVAQAMSLDGKGSPGPSRESVHGRELNVKIGSGQMPMYVEVCIIPQGSRGQDGVYLVMFEDLTEQKKLEAEVRRLDRLSTAGRLAAGIAHEIKNPLVSIQTFAQLLPERSDDPDFLGSFAKVVGSETKRINRMIQNLLHLAHPRKPHRTVFPVAAVLDEVLGILEYRLRKDNIVVERVGSERELYLYADREQVYQLFLNLIQNAAEAMQAPPKHIRIEARVLRRLDEAEEKKMVQISVQDTGPGIPPEDLPHLFDPFFTTKASGHGLGLSICYTIVREHNGTIRGRNRTDTRGSEFIVTLPLFEPATGGRNTKQVQSCKAS